MTGTSQGGFIREVLRESRPVLERMAVTLEAAVKLRAGAATEAAENMRRAQQEIEQSVGVALDLFDEHTGSLIDLAEKVGERRRRRRRGSASARPGDGGGDALTPLSNRGVRNDHGLGGKPITVRVLVDSSRAKLEHKKRAKKGGRDVAL